MVYQLKLLLELRFHAREQLRNQLVEVGLGLNEILALVRQLIMALPAVFIILYCAHVHVAQLAYHGAQFVNARIGRRNLYGLSVFKRRFVGERIIVGDSLLHRIELNFVAANV
ncbi:hypothetical protein SDC9_187355 [bioreactor metagenome]|uniref:Uncharacterized protein n=1 Tax=bioreactor metagenome TaxID=1076179 RepID=A0A645HLD5_9ZZZZ